MSYIDKYLDATADKTGIDNLPIPIDRMEKIFYNLAEVVAGGGGGGTAGVPEVTIDTAPGGGVFTPEDKEKLALPGAIINDLNGITYIKYVDAGSKAVFLNFEMGAINTIQLNTISADLENGKWVFRAYIAYTPTQLGEAGQVLSVNGSRTGISWETVPNFYTFICDTDEKLRMLADNVPGNDYTTVLIKGDLTYTGYIILPSICKRVDGFPGSSLTLIDSDGIRFSESTEHTEMNNLNITGKQIERQDQAGGISGASVVRNCNVTVTASRNAFCFDRCSFVENCRAYAYAEVGGESSIGTFGFMSCKNLSNCHADVFAAASGLGSFGPIGYFQCENLNNCSTVSKITEGTSTGFFECKQLVNCSGIAQVSGIHGVMYGFDTCHDLYNCKGSGWGGSPSMEGFGFYKSTMLLACKREHLACNTGVFSDNCTIGGKPVAYSAEGGWNDTSNN